MVRSSSTERTFWGWTFKIFWSFLHWLSLLLMTSWITLNYVMIWSCTEHGKRSRRNILKITWKNFCHLPESTTKLMSLRRLIDFTQRLIDAKQKIDHENIFWMINLASVSKRICHTSPNILGNEVHYWILFAILSKTFSLFLAHYHGLCIVNIWGWW